MTKYHLTTYFKTKQLCLLLLVYLILLILDSTYFIQNLKPGLDKLEPKAMKCVFIGYSRTQKGYRCFDLVHNRFYTSSDVTFFESVP